MAKRQQAKERVNYFLIEMLGASEEDLIDLENESLLQDFGIDSIDVAELEMEFEKELDCIINSEGVKTYGELVSLYEDKMS